MTEHKSEEVHVFFTNSMDSGDLESLCALYEAEAKIVSKPGQSPIAGSQAVREFLKGFLMAKANIHLKTRPAIQAGDIALLQS